MIQRQKNMDYSLCNAMAYNTRDIHSGLAILRFLIVYDVACQYNIHFMKRIRESEILSFILLGVFLGHISFAVGKFHLGAHKDECYAEYSLNHKEGAGLDDGEVLERDWSNLNGIVVKYRTASTAARMEGIDNGMQYLNFRKITSGGICQCTLFRCNTKACFLHNSGNCFKKPF